MCQDETVGPLDLVRASRNVRIQPSQLRVLGTILFIVGIMALVVRVERRLQHCEFSPSGLALPLGAIVLSLAHLLAPSNQRAYQELQMPDTAILRFSLVAFTLRSHCNPLIRDFG